MKLLMLSISVVCSVQSQSPLSEQEERLQSMLRSLAGPSEPGFETNDLRMDQRMDPLLRVLMVSALQRSRDELEKNNLSPPRYKQDPLLRQLRQNVVESFADLILELPSRTQDHLLRILRAEGETEPEIGNLFPPPERQDPLLRQLAQSSQSDQGASLTPPVLRKSLIRHVTSRHILTFKCDHVVCYQTPRVGSRAPQQRTQFLFHRDLTRTRYCVNS